MIFEEEILGLLNGRISFRKRIMVKMGERFGFGNQNYFLKSFCNQKRLFSDISSFFCQPPELAHFQYGHFFENSRFFSREKVVTGKRYAASTPIICAVLP